MLTFNMITLTRQEFENEFYKITIYTARSDWLKAVFVRKEGNTVSSLLFYKSITKYFLCFYSLLQTRGIAERTREKVLDHEP